MAFSLSKKEIVKEIVKSGKDPQYFINNYCRISHPMHGLIPFKTYPYQDDLINDFNSLASLAIAELSDEKLFIHAGVVEWKGKAILLPGRSHSGKTTLVAELVKCGASYYSDDFAVIDKQGYVTAYQKPLSIRKPGEYRQTDVPVEEIGGEIGNTRLPVGLIVLSQYKKYAKWKPQYLSPGIGLLLLLANTHSTQRAPDRAIKVLKRVISDTVIVKSIRGEARMIAPRLLSGELQAIEHE